MTSDMEVSDDIISENSNFKILGLDSNSMNYDDVAGANPITNNDATGSFPITNFDIAGSNLINYGHIADANKIQYSDAAGDNSMPYGHIAEQLDNTNQPRTSQPVGMTSVFVSPVKNAPSPREVYTDGKKVIVRRKSKKKKLEEMQENDIKVKLEGGLSNDIALPLPGARVIKRRGPRKPKVLKDPEALATAGIILARSKVLHQEEGEPGPTSTVDSIKRIKVSTELLLADRGELEVPGVGTCVQSGNVLFRLLPLKAYKMKEKT